MKKNKLLLLLDELVDREPGTLKEEDELAEIDDWDSLAILGLIAMVDEKFGITLHPENIAKSKTIADIVALLEVHLD